MTREDAKVIVTGMIPDGFDHRRLTDQAREEMKAALLKILELVKPAVSCGWPYPAIPDDLKLDD